MKKILFTFLTFLIALPLALPTRAEESPFSDLDEGTKYYDAITYLRNDGTIAGYDDGTFRPDDEVNRVEALKIILRGAGIEPATNDITSPFSDVGETAWYYPYLAEGISRNVVSGYEDGTFLPANPVNLVEALKMIVNTNELVPEIPSADEDFFADADATTWYAPYLNYANKNGLVYADSNNNIYPDKNLTRAELCYIIYRLKTGYFSGKIEYGQATFYGQIFEDMGTASGEAFNENELTAAHKTLPFGTYVRVTNLANGKTVTVKINDRGPYGEGRIIDLSKVAFAEIGSLSTGVLNVEIEIVYPDSEAS